MCGRVKALSPGEVRRVVEELERGIALSPMEAGASGPGAGPDGEPRGEARPGSELDVIVPAGAARGSGAAAAAPDGKLAIARLSWGFPVDWQQGRVYNTRIESALDGAEMWRDAIAEGRCVVPVASYFEPHATQTVPSPKTGRPVKRQYEFSMPDGAPMLVAGVREAGYVSLVTTAPNAVMAPVHKRMPLMLYPDEVAVWLGPEFARLADRSSFQMLAEPEPQLEQGQETLF